MAGLIPQIPILLIWFNRPQHAKRVLERLRECRPPQLFVAIDGPRAGHPTDAKNVAECMRLIDSIDWLCTVKRLVRQENLGCKYGVSSAIDWFFEQVEYGVILEDDCLPDHTFLNFCAELLIKYKDQETIMHVNGTNLVTDHKFTEDSYYFSSVCHIWGWATWRRAWQHYDLTMKQYIQHLDAVIDNTVEVEKSRRYWRKVFKVAYAGKVDTWDYQWVFSIWAQRGLCIMPVKNLVTNIGFDETATHTKLKTPFANLDTDPLGRLIHPPSVDNNIHATQWLLQTLYSQPTKITGWMNRIRGRFSI